MPALVMAAKWCTPCSNKRLRSSFQGHDRPSLTSPSKEAVSSSPMINSSCCVPCIALYI